LEVDLRSDFAVDNLSVYTQNLDATQTAVGLQTYADPDDLRTTAIPVVQTETALFWSLASIPSELRCRTKFYLYDNPSDALVGPSSKTLSIHDTNGNLLDIQIEGFAEERIHVVCIQSALCDTPDEQNFPAVAYLGLDSSVAAGSGLAGWLVVDDPETGYFQMIPGTPVQGSTPSQNWLSVLQAWRSDQVTCFGSENTITTLISLINNSLRCP
jgi:hypothetical protein